jgi:hypothetical protein
VAQSQKGLAGDVSVFPSANVMCCLSIALRWAQISKTASQNIGIDALAVAATAAAGLALHGLFLSVNATCCW